MSIVGGCVFQQQRHWGHFYTLVSVHVCVGEREKGHMYSHALHVIPERVIANITAMSFYMTVFIKVGMIFDDHNKALLGML